MRDAVAPRGANSEAAADTGSAHAGPAEAGRAEAGRAEAGRAEAGRAEAGPAEAGPAEAGAVDTTAGSNWPVAFDAAIVAMFGDELPRVRTYADLLTGAGVERGIIGPAEAERIWDRHLLNCGAIARLIPASGLVVDLGSGAGLPGIVLAILLPGASVTLLEPLARRVDFLTECVAELKLANVTVLRGRAEDLAGQLSADVVTARAVAPLDRLAGLMLGLLRPGGRGLAIKGETAAAELARSRPALARLGVGDAKIVHANGPAGVSGAEVSAGAVSAGAVSAGAVSATAVPAAPVPATTVVMFTAPEHRGSGSRSGRAPARGPARPGGPATGASRNTRGAAGGSRRSRPNSRRGGG